MKQNKILATLLISTVVLSQGVLISSEVAKAETNESAVTQLKGNVVTADNVTISNGKYTIPETNGVSYKIDGVVVDSGEYDYVSDLSVIAVPENGYTLSKDSGVAWDVHADEVTLADKEVNPTGVKLDKETHKYTIPKTEGVDYKINDKVVEAGEYELKKGESVKIIAVPKEGYVLANNATSSWEFTYKDASTSSTSESDSSSTSSTSESDSSSTSSTSSSSTDDHKSPEALNGTNYIGYYQDSDGKWHKVNGDLATDEEVKEIEEILANASSSGSSSNSDTSTTSTSDQSESSSSSTTQTTSATASSVNNPSSSYATGNPNAKNSYASTGEDSNTSLIASLAGLPMIAGVIAFVKRKF